MAAPAAASAASAAAPAATTGRGRGRKTYFAAVGDVHGQFRLVVRMLRRWEAQMQAERPGCRLAFALQVGDIECHRDEQDMTSMAAPARKRRLGDFADLYGGAVQLPCPTFFIGGNHECYGWLDEDEASEAVDLSDLGLPTGSGQAMSAGWRRRPKQVAKNLFYLGRAGILTLRVGSAGGLRFQSEDLATHYLRNDKRTVLDENLFSSAVLANLKTSSHPKEVKLQRKCSKSHGELVHAEDGDDELELGQGSEDGSSTSVDEEEADGQAPPAPEDDETVLNIAGLSGIYSEQSYYQKRPSTSHLSTASNKTWIGFNCYDVSRILSGEDADAAAELPGGEEEEEEVEGKDDAETKASRLRAEFLAAFERCLGRCLADEQSLLGTQDLLRVFQHAASGSRLAAQRALDNYRSKCSSAGLQANLPASLVRFFEGRARSLSTSKRGALLSRFARSSLVEILLTHDWPEGLVPEGTQLRGSRPMGNAVAREVTESLRPQLHLCGHMHSPLRTQIKAKADKGGGSASGSGTIGIAERPDDVKDHIDVCCLAKVGLQHSTAFFEYDWDSGLISEVNPPVGLPSFVGPGDDVDSSSDD